MENLVDNEEEIKNRINPWIIAQRIFRRDQEDRFPTIED
jgi:hypothetical protein